MCDSDEAVEPLVSAFRRARKQHECFAHYTAIIYDGFEAFKHCLRCWAIGNAILEAGGESCQYDLHCGVSWEEAFGGPPPDEIARLAFLTREEAQRLRVDSPWDDEVGEGKA